MILVSDYLNLGDALDKEGIFDSALDIDANYFINIKRLMDTDEECFKDSYEKIQKYFNKLYRILSSTDDKNSRLYKEAERSFRFHEINNLGLGYAKGKNGSGFGKKLAQKIISDAKEIINAGIKDPDLFQLIGLFEDNVGADRLSDMYSNLVFEDIIRYTLAKNEKLGITKENYPKLNFKNGFLLNPYRNNKPVLLLPKDILHELPIANDWEDIDRVCAENNLIRSEINDVIGDGWKNVSISEKKKFIKEVIMKDEAKFKNVIADYKKYKIQPYDFEDDKVGFYVISKELKNIDIGTVEISSEDSTKDVVMKICSQFKDLIENNALVKILYDKDGTFKNEKAVQLLFYAIAESYCKAFDIDVSPELNSGRGNIDFKFSTGHDDRIIVEIKLTTNKQLIHGLKTQIQEYAKAEKTDKLVYLVIDNLKNEKKIEQLYSEYNIMEKKPELVVISTELKKSASVY